MENMEAMKWAFLSRSGKIIPMSISSLLIIFGAKYLIVVIALIAGGYALKLPRPKQLLMIKIAAISFPVIFLLSRLASLVYYDPRPFVTGHFIPLIPHDPDNGFPSDHTLLSAAIAALVYTLNRRIGLALFALALLVGIARIAAGVHSPIDIAGSIAIAILITWATNKALKAYAARKEKNFTPPG